MTKAQIAFKALYVNWFHEETKWYMENFNIDYKEHNVSNNDIFSTIKKQKSVVVQYIRLLDARNQLV